jgi:hypothetical protein
MIVEKRAEMKWSAKGRTTETNRVAPLLRVIKKH